MKLIKQSGIMTMGTILNSLLGLFFYILIGRFLSVATFGYFSFLLGIGVMVAELGDFGINSSIVKYAHGDKFKAVLTIAFIERVFVGSIIFGLAIFGQFLYPANFLLSALVAWFSLLLYIVLQALIAQQRYFWYVFLNILGNTIRLGLIVLLINTNLLSVETGIGAFVLANVISFTTGLLIIGLPFVTTGLTNVFKEIFPYSIWAGMSFGVASLAAKIDNPLVYFFSGAVPAGIYSSSQRLASVIPQMNASVEGVFSPKLVSDSNNRNFVAYLLISIAAGVGLMLVIPFSGILITTVFGAKYLEAIGSFQLILFGMVFVLLSGPFSSAVLYKFGKSNWHFVSSLCQLGLSILLYWLFVPKYKAIGAAVVFIIVQAVNLVLFICIYAKNYNSHNR